LIEKTPLRTTGYVCDLTMAGVDLLSYMQHRQNNYAVIVSRPDGWVHAAASAADPRRPSPSDRAGEAFSVLATARWPI